MNTYKNIKDILYKISQDPKLKDLEYLLSLDDPKAIEIIFSFADKIRKDNLGNGVFLRGIIEFSNFCDNSCYYCGLNKNNKMLQRYKLDKKQILEQINELVKLKIKTVVLQSGEYSKLDTSWLIEVIQAIKQTFPIAITLCLGEREFKDYKLFKLAGADRYLLKIETTDENLYQKLHPKMSFKNRLNCLKQLKKLEYRVGTGIIVGLKGQTINSLAKDILFFKRGDFDMVSIGPFIAHRNTKLAQEPTGQVLLTLKMIALSRIVTKNTNIPATTALGSLDKDYRLDGLKCGANVIMPNFTPVAYKKLYEIYPNKKCINEEGRDCITCIGHMVKSIGRFINFSKGERKYANHT